MSCFNDNLYYTTTLFLDSKGYFFGAFSSQYFNETIRKVNFDKITNQNLLMVW